MLRLVFVALCLYGGDASAAPLFAALAAPAFFAGTAYAISWGSVIFTAGSLLYGAATQRKQKKAITAAAQAQRDSANASLTDRTVSGIATEFPWRFVYGIARVGANVVAMFATGARDEYKHLVCVLAQHQSHSIDDIYINGQALGALDGDGGVTSGPFLKVETGNVVQGVAWSGLPTTVVALAHPPLAGTLIVLGQVLQDDISVEVPVPYSLSGQTLTIQSEATPFKVTYQYRTQTSMVRVRKHLGVPGDPVDATLQASVGASLWPSTATLSDHTYIVIRLNLNQPEFQGGPPQIEAIMHGKLLLDPRTATTAWSENNALVALDYLTSEIGGVKVSSIPTASFISAANDCDDEVLSGFKRYTFNGVITSDQSREDVLESIAQSMAGGIDATTWTIFAGKFSAPVMAISQADIVGEIGISPGLSFGDIFNTVKGRFIGPSNLWVATDYLPYQNAAYLASDGEELDTNVDFPFTNTQQRCTNLARILTESNRNGYTVMGRFSLKTWKLQVGQRITLASPFFFGGLTKTFRVTDKAFAPDKMVMLGLKEDAESIYDLADAVSPDSTPNTGLPNPFVVDTLASLICESGDAQLLIQEDGTIVSRILATWPQSTTQGVLQKGYIEVEFQEVGEPEWQKVEVDGFETSAFLSPVRDGSFYNVRARGVNPYVAAKGDWAYAALHQVIGKTEPPPDVLTFTVLGQTFTWGPVVALDLAGYEIRFNFGQNTAWGTGTPLHTGLITESPWTPLVFPSGPVTIMVKAIDTSGNESSNAASIQTNLGDPIVANLIEVYDDKAAGFAGTVVNGSVSGGNMVADDSGDLFWGQDSGNFWGQDGALFWPASTYLQMVYTLSYTVTANEVGSRLTLLTDIVAESYTIEYRFGTQGLFWGSDEAFFWGADADLFWAQPTDWQTWPGGIDALTEGDIEIRITTQAGSVQGSINELTLQFDVEDETEFLNDIVIAPGGTRLPITKSYRSIKNILMTSQAVGGDTPIPITLDKLVDPGPLVATYEAGISVDGLIDAQIQGVKGN